MNMNGRRLFKMLEDFAYNVAENFGITESEESFDSLELNKIPTVSNIGAHVPIFGKLETVYRPSSFNSALMPLTVRTTTTTTSTTSTTTSKSSILPESLTKYNHISKMDKVRHLANFAKYLFKEKVAPENTESSRSFPVEPMLIKEKVLSRKKRQFSVFSLLNFLLVVFNVVIDINNNINNNN